MESINAAKSGKSRLNIKLLILPLQDRRTPEDKSVWTDQWVTSDMETHLVCTKTHIAAAEAFKSSGFVWLVWAFFKFLARNLYGFFSFYYTDLFKIQEISSSVTSLGKTQCLLAHEIVYCMGIKAASCLQFQARGMIFWDETGDKNFMICLLSLNWRCLLSWHFVVLVMDVGLEFFAEHLLKCVHFYNLSHTALEGGSSADKAL